MITIAPYDYERRSGAWWERKEGGDWKLCRSQRMLAVLERLSAQGRPGGSVSSAAKTAAARENGKKGGRPKKHPP